jgi:hypothetical protein
MTAEDTVWYGRVGVWFGVVLLFLMAATGRSLTVLTVVAVVTIVVGFVVLVYGLAIRPAAPITADSQMAKDADCGHE